MNREGKSILDLLIKNEVKYTFCKKGYLRIAKPKNLTKKESKEFWQKIMKLLEEVGLQKVGGHIHLCKPKREEFSSEEMFLFIENNELLINIHQAKAPPNTHQHLFTGEDNNMLGWRFPIRSLVYVKLRLAS
ncbi:MAG: hypothetical protein H6791_03020 [Candidatus Nomurabacteria bacterium]|nr:MAG: hypothetical protein H6791_03020 [Candidatus Nomurabacteria bacterium]